MLTIEKRLPFGFKGEWGQVYKIYTPTVSASPDYAEVWVFNEEPSAFTDKTFYVNYYYYYLGEKTECSNIEFTTYDGGGQDAILFNSASHTGGYIGLEEQGWIDGDTKASRTLYFTQPIDTTGGENTLGYWLKRNAKKVLGLEWQKAFYADIGQDVQFKYPEDGYSKEFAPSQTVINLINSGEYRQAKTTDAYFDENTKSYKCVVGLGDIVCLSGDFYVCETVKVRNILTPQEQSFYYLGLRKIYDVILKGVANA